ncbi:MAG: hypothetical protein JKY60_20045 [Kordiimonadaceae bacterium]|nr:hypothetical protein [Kordiimonadaceae bacterium]
MPKWAKVGFVTMCATGALGIVMFVAANSRDLRDAYWDFLIRYDIVLYLAVLFALVILFAIVKEIRNTS